MNGPSPPDRLRNAPSSRQHGLPGTPWSITLGFHRRGSLPRPQLHAAPVEDIQVQLFGAVGKVASRGRGGTTIGPQHPD